MIANVLRSVYNNFQNFLGIWIVIILINQLFIFGACFAPYCIMAALPHTAIIAAIIVYIVSEQKTNNDKN